MPWGGESQNLARLWNGSNFGAKREILEAVSLNRSLSHVSLYLTKRKPFDSLAEGLTLKDGRGDWRNFERGRGPVATMAAVLMETGLPHRVVDQYVTRESA